MATTLRSVATLAAASVLGLGLGVVDSSPGWDDTGVSAAVLLILCASFGTIRTVPAWASAMAIAAWIPILNIARAGNNSSLMVLPIALIAAYVGRGLSKLLLRAGAG